MLSMTTKTTNVKTENGIFLLNIERQKKKLMKTDEKFKFCSRISHTFNNSCIFMALCRF